VTAPADPTYREVARHVRKYPPEELLREIARLAAAETHRRMRGGSVEPPETPFAFAGLARTVIAETRSSRLPGSAARARGRISRRGTDHRRSGVSPEQVRTLCDEMIRTWSPEALAAGDDDVGVLMASIAFEQFGPQWSAMENLSRAHSLIVDATAAHSDLPDSSAWAAELGVDLDTFLRTGFALHVAMAQNEGQVSRDVLKGSNLRPIREPLTPEELFEIVDTHFALDFDEHRRRCRQAQQVGWEKWSFSSLIASPLVSFGNDLVCPAPHLLLDRVSSTGLWYIGREAWGSGFTSALGGAFEDYVGQHLALLEHAVVLPEITYSTGKGTARSCDWFVITDVVVLVEVKCARPLYGYRLGDAAALDDVRSKVGGAVRQLEATARLVQDRHPSFLDVPADRPLRGLVLTLEPYYLPETFRDHILQSDLFPVSIAWAHELENACAQLREEHDAGAQLLEALTPKESLLVVAGSLTEITRGKTPKRNPIVDASWDAWATWPALTKLSHPLCRNHLRPHGQGRRPLPPLPRRRPRLAGIPARDRDREVVQKRVDHDRPAVRDVTDEKLRALFADTGPILLDFDGPVTALLPPGPNAEVAAAREPLIDAGYELPPRLSSQPRSSS
jgi:hypothetical protein